MIWFSGIGICNYYSALAMQPGMQKYETVAKNGDGKEKEKKTREPKCAVH